MVFEGDFVNDVRVRGKLTIEAPGKMPIVVEVDHEKQNVSMFNRLPPPMVRGLVVWCLCNLERE